MSTNSGGIIFAGPSLRLCASARNIVLSSGGSSRSATSTFVESQSVFGGGTVSETLGLTWSTTLAAVRPNRMGPRCHLLTSGLPRRCVPALPDFSGMSHLDSKEGLEWSGRRPRGAGPRLQYNGRQDPNYANFPAIALAFHGRILRGRALSLRTGAVPHASGNRLRLGRRHLGGARPRAAKRTCWSPIRRRSRGRSIRPTARNWPSSRRARAAATSTS